MKTLVKNTYIYPLLLAAGLLIAGCADFLNVNTDTTRLKTSSMPLVLSSAEGNLAMTEGVDLLMYSSIFAQQITGNGVTGNQAREYDKYIVTNTDVNNLWVGLFAGVLADCDYIRKNAYAEGNPQYGGIAKILTAYTYSTIVDAWGSVPYTDAMKGVKNPSPKYDASKTVYDSLFVLLDAGILDLSKSNIRAVGNEDLIYGGGNAGIAKWIKFANTLKLRLALHYAKDDGGAKLNAVINAGGPFMTSNADNFEIAFENVTNRQNPIHQFELVRQDYLWPSNFFVNLLKSKNDPRVTTYFQPSPYPATFPYTPTIADNYVGQVPGATQSVAASRLGTYLRGAVIADNLQRTGGNLNTNSLTYTGAAPFRFLTFAEYNFIRAEAALVYGAAGSATTFFQAGVTASMNAAGLQGTAATAATTYGATNYPGAPTLQNIIEEKYVANFGQPMEQWSDWRRTGFPVLPLNPAAAAVANTQTPRILVYALSETSANAANLPPRSTLTEKGVFWDK